MAHMLRRAGPHAGGVGDLLDEFAATPAAAVPSPAEHADAPSGPAYQTLVSAGAGPRRCRTGLARRTACRTQDLWTRQQLPNPHIFSAMDNWDF